MAKSARPLRILVLLGAALSTLGTASAPRAEPPGSSITIDVAHPGHAISPTLYGIFFEEINHAGDGGLYAELLRDPLRRRDRPRRAAGPFRRLSRNRLDRRRLPLPGAHLEAAAQRPAAGPGGEARRDEARVRPLPRRLLLRRGPSRPRLPLEE